MRLGAIGIRQEERTGPLTYASLRPSCDQAAVEATNPPSSAAGRRWLGRSKEVRASWFGFPQRTTSPTRLEKLEQSEGLVGEGAKRLFAPVPVDSGYGLDPPAEGVEIQGIPAGDQIAFLPASLVICTCIPMRGWAGCRQGSERTAATHSDTTATAATVRIFRKRRVGFATAGTLAPPTPFVAAVLSQESISDVQAYTAERFWPGNRWTGRCQLLLPADRGSDILVQIGRDRLPIVEPRSVWGHGERISDASRHSSASCHLMSRHVNCPRAGANRTKLRRGFS